VHLKSLELQGFKSFGRKATIRFDVPVVAVVGPNGSGKSNVAEAFRFALGEQSAKAMRGRRGEDLIWHGSPELPRAGKASVKIVFDNRDRALPLDFDDVSLERVVHRDGVNEYAVNGAPVRLRDTLELLAAANIGPSGHHIVSQGEADRVLAANPKERREILQDALGLRALEWKRAEALRKLGKTEENSGQVRSLLSELEPRLRFLKRQVEKVERAERLRQELLERYRAYLALESARVRAARSRAIEALRAPNDEKERLAAKIRDEEMRASRVEAPQTPEGLVEAEAALAGARERARRLGREIGAAEGELAALERMATPVVRAPLPPDERPIPRSRVREALEVARQGLRRASAAQTYDAAYEALHEAVLAVEALVEAPVAHEEEVPAEAAPDFSARAAEIAAKLGELRLGLEAADADERRAEAAAQTLRAARDAARVEVAEAERALVGLVSRKGELEREIDRLAAEARAADSDEEQLRSEMQEAVALVGREALDFEAAMVTPDVNETREVALARRKELERMKLRLEEAGAAGGEEVMKEYREATARDEFLRKELADLDASAATLRELIEDLERKVSERFSDGLAKINAAFGELFAAMFGGGHAALKVTRIEKRRRADDDLADLGEAPAEEAEEGVEVSVELPKKRVAGLFQLSGGERSLVSIALLFAMSRVAPPPFVILDETDAALDEANSRRYGDMIEKLAERSQLVLITHNRETMSRAGALYGVTAGSVGSTLLSVKFDDAAAMAAR
jgi:chromosome segregation protein